MAYPISKLACEYVPTVTTAIYNNVSVLNQPELTAYSPTTIPATILNGVDNKVGVLTAAIFNPSTANSRIKSCHIRGTVISSETVIKLSHCGIQCGFCTNKIHTGVSNMVTKVKINRESLRYVPIRGAKL